MRERSEILMLVTSALLLLAGCGTQSEAPAGGEGQKGNGGMNALQDRTFSNDAEQLYVEKCSMCHRQFGMGTVLLGRRVDKDKVFLEDRNDLTSDFVIVAARQGIGNMPRIPRGEVSDDQLQIIAQYLAKQNK